MSKIHYKTRNFLNDFVYDVVKCSSFPDGEDEVLLTTSIKSLAFSFYDQLCDVNPDLQFAVILRQSVKTLIYNSRYE